MKSTLCGNFNRTVSSMSAVGRRDACAKVRLRFALETLQQSMRRTSEELQAFPISIDGVF